MEHTTECKLCKKAYPSEDMLLDKNSLRPYCDTCAAEIVMDNELIEG